MNLISGLFSVTMTNQANPYIMKSLKIGRAEQVHFISLLYTRFPFSVEKTIILCETVASLSPVLVSI